MKVPNNPKIHKPTNPIEMIHACVIAWKIQEKEFQLAVTKLPERIPKQVFRKIVFWPNKDPAILFAEISAFVDEFNAYMQTLRNTTQHHAYMILGKNPWQDASLDQLFQLLQERKR
jgi:hypothetical protein